MSIFSRLYTGVLDTVYGFKLKSFRSQLEKKEMELPQHIVRKVEAGKAVDFLKIRHVLIVKNESLSDMIMVTPLIRHLMLNGYKVDVFASEENQIILQSNPYVHDVIVQTGGENGAQNFVLEQMKDRHYDMVLDLRTPVYDENLDRLLFPQHISCDYLVGWNRSNMGVYDKSLEIYDEKAHFDDVSRAFLNYFGIQGVDLSYDVPVSMAVKESGLHYMRNLWRKGGPIVVLHPFSNDASLCLSEFQISSLVDKILECYPFSQLVITGLPEQLSPIKVNALQEAHAHKYIFSSIMDLVPLFEYADVLITSEVAVMHVASTFQKPLVALTSSMEGVALKSKEKVLSEHDYQKELLMAKFLDAPNIKSGARSEHYLFRAGAWVIGYEKLEQVFSTTRDMTYLSLDAVVNAFQRLSMQYVQDPQYVSPMKALSYVQMEENKPIEPIEEADAAQAEGRVEKNKDEETKEK